EGAAEALQLRRCFYLAGFLGERGDTLLQCGEARGIVLGRYANTAREQARAKCGTQDLFTNVFHGLPFFGGLIDGEQTNAEAAPPRRVLTGGSLPRALRRSDPHRARNARFRCSNAPLCCLRGRSTRTSCSRCPGTAGT